MDTKLIDGVDSMMSLQLFALYFIKTRNNYTWTTHVSINPMLAISVQCPLLNSLNFYNSLNYAPFLSPFFNKSER